MASKSYVALFFPQICKNYFLKLLFPKIPGRFPGTNFSYLSSRTALLLSFDTSFSATGSLCSFLHLQIKCIREQNKSSISLEEMLYLYLLDPSTSPHLDHGTALPQLLDACRSWHSSLLISLPSSLTTSMDAKGPECQLSTQKISLKVFFGRRRFRRALYTFQYSTWKKMVL